MDFSLGFYVYFLLQVACNDVLRIFYKLDTSFEGIINPNEVDEASSDVLEYLRWRMDVSPLP